MSASARPDPAPVQPQAVVSDVIPTPIPGVKQARTVVLCFDGTGDEFGTDNSNIVNFFSLLQKDDHNEQVVYYQAGIGTYVKNQHATGHLRTKWLKLTDEAFAWSLDGHVIDGYKFLMDKYQSGDKICIFGFSRGAYTARSLAGMIQKVGLLPSGNEEQIPFAYRMYKRTDKEGWRQSVQFKKALSIDVDIEFVGVWDTVASVGLTFRRLPFVSSNSAIRYFRHAVSLDERRAMFKNNMYNRPTEAEQKLGVQPGEMPKARIDSTPSKSQLETFFSRLSSNRKSETQIEEEQQTSEELLFAAQESYNLETDVYEVWFAGSHGDVGGGCVSNESRHNLARISLRWMIRECFKTNTGIRFHSSLLRNIGLDPESLYPIVKERPPALFESPLLEPQAGPSTLSPADTRTHGRTETDASAKTLINGKASSSSSPPLTEEEEDLLDAHSTLYDQLIVGNKGWWILEIFPLNQRYQRDEDDEWVEEPVINMGRGRTVPKHNPFYVHRSVQIRMEAKNHPQGPYTPKAVFDKQPIFVD